MKQNNEKGGRGTMLTESPLREKRKPIRQPAPYGDMFTPSPATPCHSPFAPSPRRSPSICARMCCKVAGRAHAWTRSSRLGTRREPQTVEAALRQLEKEKLLINPGKGKPRRIKPGATRASNSLRVTLLLSDRSEQGWEVITETLHRLRQAGHETFYAEKTLGELGM